MGIKTKCIGIIRSQIWFGMRKAFLLSCLGKKDACPGTGQFSVPTVPQQKQECPLAGATEELL